MGSDDDVVAKQPTGYFVIVTFVNFLNFVDRGIIPGSTNEFNSFIKDHIDTSTPDLYLGLLQSSFIIGFSIAAVVFGNLVHYYSPFFLCGVGLSVWIVSVFLSGSAYYMDSYIFLVIARMLSGVGEASFQCSLPPWIAKHAEPSKRGKWLSIFYTAIPVGTAVGYAYSAVISDSLGWSWAFFIEGFVMIPFVIFLFANAHKYPCERNLHSRGETDSKNQRAIRISTVDKIGGEDLNRSSDRNVHGLNKADSNEVTYNPLGHAVNDAEDNYKESSSNNPREKYQSSSADITRKGENALSTDEDSAMDRPPTAFEELRIIFRKPIYLCLVAGYAAQSGALIGISTFGSAFLMGLGFFDSETTASSIFGVFVSLAGIIGTPIGGLLLDKLDQTLKRSCVTKDRLGGNFTDLMIPNDRAITFANSPLRAALIIITFCSLGGAFSMVLVYFIEDRWLWLFVVSVACAMIFSSIPGINLGVMMSVPDKHRSFAIALSSLCIHVFGDVPSPIVAGYLKDSLAPKCTGDDDEIAASSGCREDSEGLRLTILIISLWLFWCFIFFLLAWRQSVSSVYTLQHLEEEEEVRIQKEKGRTGSDADVRDPLITH